MGNQTYPETKPVKLVYIIGRYPELTDTFIDREIGTLRQLGKFQIHIVSIRYPLTLGSSSPEQQAICQETLYLIPRRWADFDFLAFIAANLYFIFLNPRAYFGMLIYLLRGSHPNLQTRLLTILHFWQGVYAAYLLRRKEFDHIHVHFIDRAVIVAMIVSRFLNKTYSLTAHAADIYANAILVPEKMINASFLVTVSKYNKEYLIKTYPSIDPGMIHVLHPWVDLSHFIPSAAHKLVTSKLHILSVGRLVEKKGHGDLIEACYMLHELGVDLECRIIGAGPLRSSLEEAIAKYSLQDVVRLIGAQCPNKVLDLLSTWADIFALPCVIASNGDRDGIPVSLAEAMAMNVPVVSTDIVGICELVQPGTGVLVSPHHPADLAEALRVVWAQNQLVRDEMGHRGRAVVDEEFNLIKGTRQLAVLFQETAAENARGDNRGIWPALH